MNLSREAKGVSGITLLAVPTIMYGGVTLLGILTTGRAGTSPGNLVLDETQWALFRAGHAHAGVWVLLSLVIQVLLDSATLSRMLKWLTRIWGGSGTRVSTLSLGDWPLFENVRQTTHFARC